ncbi:MULTISPECIES: Rid family hydrolase [unclassified Sinorhizobium]|uniref:Rid family hydrolase n=1 Tax=unclassified Sinorhizobium TaxID=2613772 RepID=UPI0024C2A74D|nr:MULTISPECIES: Rid family hydrolase [unclassified Sinorhizobium]MDK1378157.1 Rid family hydrolase [Sinorhizobium sp. 6-70]MDK1479794.1 Rid family hydrolase [Sinorhizobium sp. 6-117]
MDDILFPIERASGVAPGRSSGSAYGNLVWAVATSDDKQLELRGQIAAAFAKIDRLLAELKTDKRYLLSANVLLSDLKHKKAFDSAWKEWIGDNPHHWPQRACVGAILSPGTLVEIAVVAARPS